MVEKSSVRVIYCDFFSTCVMDLKSFMTMKGHYLNCEK